MLGFLRLSSDEWFQGDFSQSDQVNDLIFQRSAAKARRDFAEADRIRDALAVDGVLLEDGPDGTIWRRA